MFMLTIPKTIGSTLILLLFIFKLFSFHPGSNCLVLLLHGSVTILKTIHLAVVFCYFYIPGHGEKF